MDYSSYDSQVILYYYCENFRMNLVKKERMVQEIFYMMFFDGWIWNMDFYYLINVEFLDRNNLEGNLFFMFQFF